MKRTPLVAALFLVLGLLVGCGSSDSSTAADDGGSAGGPPTNASVEEFCGTFLDLIEQASQAGEKISDEDAIALAKDLADKLSEVGTPEDMPEDARRAFETAIEKIQGIPDDATKDEVEKAQQLTEEEQAYSTALSQYIASKCADQLVPTDDAG